MHLESLEARQLLAGVTLLTHGHQGSINGWVKTAAIDIAERIGRSDTSTYVMKIGEIGGDTLGVTSFTRDSGPGIDASVNAEAIIRLDWTAVDNGDYSGEEVGDVVAEYMMSTHGASRPLAGFPLHMMGHSRGAAVVSTIAKRLGERGVWVDQLTYLDQHPVNGDIDDGFIDYDDPTPRAWDNVTFVDNYWRDDGLNLEPDGDNITGSHDVNLDDTVGDENGGSAHMSVPAYYIGTIDLDTDSGGDQPIYDSWYGGANRERDETGFAFSRLGGTARPTDGLSEPFGGTAERAETDPTGSQWGTISDLQVLEGTTYTIGQTIPLRIKRQDRDDAHTITLWIDRDRNPYNDNNIRKIRSLTFDQTDEVTPTRVNGSSSDIEPGKYYVYARITDAGDHARYTYSRRITLVAPTVSAAAPPVFSSTKLKNVDSVGDAVLTA